MMLTGRTLSASQAKRLGVVDAVTPKRQLKRAARHFILQQPKPHQPSGFSKLSNARWVRPLLSKIFYKKLAAKIKKEHYPAPFAIVSNWVRDGAQGDAMVNEAKSIAELMMHDTSRNLVHVFFLQEKMKGLAKGINFKPNHVHVIGAGTMGGDIAAWCAFNGLQVSLQDQSLEKISPAIKRAHKLFKKKLKKPRLIQAAMDRLQPDVNGLGVPHADVIIEAVFENLKVKHEIFKTIESQAKKDAVLATNTSSLPLEEIGSILKDPTRLVGIHFFNPVSKMPLVEIVHGTKTSKDAVNNAMAFVAKIKRYPLPVASRPGFLVNRILMPYLMESMLLLEEGASAATIDKAAVNFGMPMGPITLADKVGLDICLSVAENLSGHFGSKVPERLKQMVESGHLGVKSGRGFYQYKKGKKVKEAADTSQKVADIEDRLILVMLNEAVACLQEGVINDADLLDGGMIFGTGFAPFRGGPIQYAKKRGVTQVVADLERLAKQYGDRFKPSKGWQQLTEESSVDTSAIGHKPIKTDEVLSSQQQV